MPTVVVRQLKRDKGRASMKVKLACGRGKRLTLPCAFAGGLGDFVDTPKEPLAGLVEEEAAPA